MAQHKAMFTKTALLISAVLCASLAAQVQQNPQPDNPPSAAQTQPSNPAEQKALLLKGSHIPNWLRRQIDLQQGKIEDKTGLHVPTPEELSKDPQSKPCPMPAPTTTPNPNN